MLKNKKFKMENRISIKLANGKELVAELSNYDGQHPEIVICVQESGIATQDICIVRPHENKENSIDCLVWGNPYDEDYLDNFEISLYKDPIYEIQLGIIADGAKDGNVDYSSPALMLVEADHYPSIEEIEQIFEKEIKALGCDCVYGITPIEEWELEVYDCYKTVPKYNL